jgi:hypothetical protein
MARVSIFLISFCILLFISFVYLSDYHKNVFEGMVYDCQTEAPLPQAEIRFAGSNTLIDLLTFHWDSATREFQGTSDDSGLFSIVHKGQVQVLRIEKEGYLRAEESTYGGRTKIGLLRRLETDDISESSTACKRRSECLSVTEQERGTMVTNVCPPLPVL